MGEASMRKWTRRARKAIAEQPGAGPRPGQDPDLWAEATALVLRRYARMRRVDRSYILARIREMFIQAYAHA